MTRRLCENSGFTLTEVLVASMLLTIVMTAVYTLFFSVISTWRSEENDEGLHRKARNVFAVLQQEYANIHAGGSYYFEGGPHEFTMFVTTQPMDVESGEGRRLMRVRYRFDAREGTLTREEAMVDETLPATAGQTATFERDRISVKRSEEFIVATGLTQFDVRYLWVQRPDSAYWRTRPVSVDPVAFTRHAIGWGLPQALEIATTFAGRDDEVAPLVVTVRMPTRTTNRQRDAWELTRMREEGP